MNIPITPHLCAMTSFVSAIITLDVLREVIDDELRVIERDAAQMNAALRM